MKPVRRYVPRHQVEIVMQELEVGDRPVDYGGRTLSFVPGDQLVRLPGLVYVLGQSLADALYIAKGEDEDAGTDHDTGER